MKIKLKYYDSWGELKECIIQVSSKGTVLDLQYELYKITEIEIEEQQVYIVKNGKQIQINNQEQFLSSIQFDKHTILFVKQLSDRFSIKSIIKKQNESYTELSTSDVFKSIHNSFIPTQNNSKMNQEITLYLEQFIEFIQKNDYDETFDILQRNSHIKEELINDTSFVGWSALHISVIVGSEKIFLLLLNEGGNINQDTRDGWDCISLAACLKQKTILCLLLGQKELNINKKNKHGSVLHLVAQIDDLDIAKILLKHPKIDLNIQNNMKQIPYDIAGPYVKKLLKEEMESRQIQFHRKSFISSLSGISVDNLSKDSFIINKPNRPPILTGKVFKVNYLKLRMYERYMIADPDTGTIARFKNRNDVPQNPNEVIPIESIDDVKVSEDEWFMEEDFYYLEIKYHKKHIFIALKEKNAARRWYEGLKNCVGYVRFINQHLNKWNSIEDQKFAKRAYSLMMQKPNIIMNIPDSQAIDQKTHIESQAVAKKNKYRQDLQSISEAEFDIDVVEEKTNKKMANYLGINSFQVFELIGRGSFGQVYRAKFKNLECALKQQEKDRLIREDFLKYTISELQILKTINHPFIVHFFMSFQTQFYLYLATELCPAGDLARYMTRGVILNEFTAKFIVAQIILAIEYLHSKKIIYRDLKPENILISQDGYIKLTDFGLCKQGGAVDIIATSFCGSPAYLPPELIAGNGSTKATDIYQIGTILYEMLTGYPPFYCQDMRTLIDNIRYQSLRIPKNVSQPAADLLKRILNKDPEERLGCQDVSILKKHIFFAEIDWNKLLAKQYKPPQLQLRLNSNQARNGFKISENQNKILDIDYQEGQEKLNYIDNWDFSLI